MSFIFSKLVWALLAPGTLLFLIALTSTLLWRKRPAISRALTIVMAVALGLLVLCPVGPWLIRPLETPFPAPDLNTLSVDGIVVLGGASDPEATSLARMIVLNDAAERLTSFVALSRRYPKARLVFSGGSGDPLRPDFREADEVRHFFAEQGLDPDRVLFERDSRNTWENAKMSLALAAPRADEHWLLVTSAWHMPRAMGCFERAGWRITAYPVDYRHYSFDRWLLFMPDQQLDMATTALREWVGLVAYRIMGRTDRLLPGIENTPP